MASFVSNAFTNPLRKLQNPLKSSSYLSRTIKPSKRKGTTKPRGASPVPTTDKKTFSLTYCPSAGQRLAAASGAPRPADAADQKFSPLLSLCRGVFNCQNIFQCGWHSKFGTESRRAPRFWKRAGLAALSRKGRKSYPEDQISAQEFLRRGAGVRPQRGGHRPVHAGLMELSGAPAPGGFGSLGVQRQPGLPGDHLLRRPQRGGPRPGGAPGQRLRHQAVHRRGHRGLPVRPVHGKRGVLPRGGGRPKARGLPAGGGRDADSEQRRLGQFYRPKPGPAHHVCRAPGREHLRGPGGARVQRGLV